MDMNRRSVPGAYNGRGVGPRKTFDRVVARLQITLD